MFKVRAEFSEIIRRRCPIEAVSGLSVVDMSVCNFEFYGPARIDPIWAFSSPSKTWYVLCQSFGSTKKNGIPDAFRTPTGNGFSRCVAGGYVDQVLQQSLEGSRHDNSALVKVFPAVGRCFFLVALYRPSGQ